MSRAMVLAAGLGSRLRPLTGELPKPLLPVGDRSLLEHALDTLHSVAGGEQVIVNVHYLSELFANYVASLRLNVRVVHEPVIRGTAGGIAAARGLLGSGPVVVQLADVMLSGVAPALLDSLSDDGLVLAVAPLAVGHGNVGVGRSGEVVRLRGQRFGEEVAGGQYVGQLALGPRALAELPDQGCYIGDYALPRLRGGGRVATCPFEASFILPGDDLDGYFAANLTWLDERREGRAFVGPSAEVLGSVELRRSLVGAGARVLGSGALERVVVLPGAQARAPLADCIVAPSGRLIPVRPPGTIPRA